jgi:hypothetical protein
VRHGPNIGLTPPFVIARRTLSLRLCGRPNFLFFEKKKGPPDKPGDDGGEGFQAASQPNAKSG